MESCTNDVAKVAFIVELDKERNQELMRTNLLHPPPNFDTTMTLAMDEILVKEFLGFPEGEKRSTPTKPTRKPKEEETQNRPTYNWPPPRRSSPPPP